MKELTYPCSEWRLPRGPLVYLLVRQGRVVYVGSTKRLSNRIIFHRKKGFDQVRFLKVRKAELRAREHELIRKFKPELNSPKTWNFHIREGLTPPIIRLDDDVAAMVAQSALINSRSLPREVNFLLRMRLKHREAK